MRAVVVGAGLAGMTAGVLLKRKNWDVLVFDTREYLGGNCSDYKRDGVYVHRHGPHIFHTSDLRVWRFINEFTGFTGYVHHVMAHTGDPGTLLPIPYSKTTERVIGRELSDSEIVDMFFRAYSERMWGCPYEEIPPQIINRVNLRRDNYDTRYFQDKYEGMPVNGYTAMFHEMALEVGHVQVLLHSRPNAWRTWAESADLVVFTGSLDEYYDHNCGTLPYRAIGFGFKHNQVQRSYPVVNYCAPGEASRTAYFGRFYDYGQDGAMSTTCTEYPMAWNKEDDSLVPSYPMVGFPEANAILSEYLKIGAPANTIFCGRLGTYRYMNMDVVISDTMARLEQRLGGTVYA